MLGEILQWTGISFRELPTSHGSISYLARKKSLVKKKRNTTKKHNKENKKLTVRKF